MTAFGRQTDQISALMSAFDTKRHPLEGVHALQHSLISGLLNVQLAVVILLGRDSL